MKTWLNQLWTPTGILTVFMFLLPWQTRYIFGWSWLSGSFTPFGIISLYATQAGVLCALLGVYLWHGWPRINSQYRTALGWAGVVGVIAVISSVMVAVSIPALAWLIDFSFAGLIFIALLDKRVNLPVVMSGFVLGLLLPIALGLYQVIVGESGASKWLGLAPRSAEALGDAVWQAPDGQRMLRAYGSFSHPNIFGGYLAVGFLLAMSGLATRLKHFQWPLCFILAFGLALTASRSALLGCLLGGGLWLLVRYFRPTTVVRKLVMPIAVTVIGAALSVTLLAPGLAASLRGGGELETRSLSERVIQYQDFPATLSWQTLAFGHGPRNYVFTQADLHPNKSVWEYQPIHNVPLLVLSEVGVLGLLALIGWMIALDRLNFSRFPHPDAALAHGLGKVLFVIIFFDHYLWSNWSGLVLATIVASFLLRAGEPSSD
ncbi:MAG: O-antigen ligase family protein [Patescibacteria group bacterium]